MRNCGNHHVEFYKQSLQFYAQESAEYPPPTYSFVWEHQQEKLGSKDIPNVTPKKEVRT